MNSHPPDELRKVSGPSPPEAEISTVAHDSPVVARSLDRAASTAPELADFGRLEEIAHGGIGIIYRARDPNLDRDLAVKVLRPDRQDRPDLARRFIEEAKITGQLQHPGVAPIHALGQTPDGRPFFTMKLIRGQTLATLLAERDRVQEPGFRGQESDKPRDKLGESGGSTAEGRQPTADSRLPRFLKIFEQVCQTLAYAHSQGIIHRDLKPANIMVGAFGEVQVMDWGFAKKVSGQSSVVGGQEAEDPTDHSPVTTQHSALSTHHTEAGAIMGTLPYMAPEQARGEVDQLDERADVFGLGAILCTILTGKPPNQGDRLASLGKAQAGDLADAFGRLAGCGADGELIELTKACLATDPADRPPDAQAVAKKIEAHLAAVQERLQQEREQRAAAEAKADEEGKRRLVERQKRRRTQGKPNASKRNGGSRLRIQWRPGVPSLWIQATQRPTTTSALCCMSRRICRAPSKSSSTPSHSLTPFCAWKTLTRKFWTRTTTSTGRPRILIRASSLCRRLTPSTVSSPHPSSSVASGRTP